MDRYLITLLVELGVVASLASILVRWSGADDVSVFDALEGRWVFHDRLGDSVTSKTKLVPRLVVRRGQTIVPEGTLLTDLKAA